MEKEVYVIGVSELGENSENENFSYACVRVCASSKSTEI